VNSPGYVLLLVLHVLTALVGFGALAMTGLFASRTASARDPLADPALRRFFRPGANLSAIGLGALPIFGALLLVFDTTGQSREAYPWIGLCCWALATAICAAVVWPCERAIQHAFADGGEVTVVRQVARRCERAVGAAVVCGVIGLAVMVVQP
jgi:hypothetical protein